MVAYGPWTQGADYERSPRYIAKGVDGWTGDNTYTYAGGGAPFDDEMNAALNAAPSGGTTIRSDLSGALEVVRFSSTSAPLEAPFTSGEIIVRKNEGGGEWDATDLLDLGYYYATYLAPTKPADAVGIEYEANAATPVRATVHATMLGGASDSSIPSGVTAAANAFLSVTLSGGQTYRDASAFLASFQAGTGTVDTFDLDLTPYMGPSGEVAIAVTVGKLGTWGYYDSNRGGDTIAAQVRASDATKATYLLHPPRHRWVYDTAPPLPPMPGLPPLRAVQRGDGRNASSAPRAVQNQTRQATNRAVSYY